MENKFEKYYRFVKVDGKITAFNHEGYKLADEAFELFKSLYDTNYGSIEEDENLISIHTGGWSENEYLIEELSQTAWWHKFHRITQSGGHYFFNTDMDADKDWCVAKKHWKQA